MALSRSYKSAARLWPAEHVTAIEEHTPNDLPGWMAQAVREAHHSSVEKKDLKKRFFGYSTDGQRFELRRGPGGLPQRGGRSDVSRGYELKGGTHLEEER